MQQAKLEGILTAAPVVPVLTIEDWRTAAPLARALVAGGLPAIEITLRTPEALEAIRAVAAEVEGARAGAGTVLSRQQLSEAARAGARFAVSPAGGAALMHAAQEFDLPFLPGAATPTETLTLLEKGYALQKFFPAEPAGGVAYLKALAAPLPGVRFCPTGGIGAGNAASYLVLPNVICVGGSWIAPQEAVAAGDWRRIEALARAATGLRRPA